MLVMSRSRALRAGPVAGPMHLGGANRPPEAAWGCLRLLRAPNGQTDRNHFKSNFDSFGRFQVFQDFRLARARRAGIYTGRACPLLYGLRFSSYGAWSRGTDPDGTPSCHLENAQGPSWRLPSRVRAACWCRVRITYLDCSADDPRAGPHVAPLTR